jgi:hypothetical protein
MQILRLTLNTSRQTLLRGSWRLHLPSSCHTKIENWGLCAKGGVADSFHDLQARGETVRWGLYRFGNSGAKKSSFHIWGIRLVSQKNPCLVWFWHWKLLKFSVNGALLTCPFLGWAWPIHERTSWALHWDGQTHSTSCSGNYSLCIHNLCGFMRHKNPLENRAEIVVIPGCLYWLCQIVT